MKDFKLADPAVPSAASQGGSSRSFQFLRRYLRDLPGLAPALLPWIEVRLELLPLDQAVRDDVLVWTILVSAVAGMGAYRSFFPDRLGWAALLVSILCLNALWVFSVADIGLDLPPGYLFLLQRSGYLLLFSLLAIAMGVFFRQGR